jgi:hypothetical protein
MGRNVFAAAEPGESRRVERGIDGGEIDRAGFGLVTSRMVGDVHVVDDIGMVANEGDRVEAGVDGVEHVEDEPDVAAESSCHSCRSTIARCRQAG